MAIKRGRLLIGMLAGMLWVGSSLLVAAESLCADVKIEISQELTLERQAFEARMKINNGFTDISLTNVLITVNFTDKDGNPVRATNDPNNRTELFFIKLDSMEGITNIAGDGVVKPSTSAVIHWLIIPTLGASQEKPQGALYFVGASLSYKIAGEPHEMKVSPDYIYVKPMPEIVLDYFLPAEVYGDDPETGDEVEPLIPFSLGVRVQNNGFGSAKNLKIDSAQPKIVANVAGLAVKFVIIGAEVQGQPMANTLLCDFGDIVSKSCKAGRWVMTSSLYGKFEFFKAQFIHSNELGGMLTSLITAVNTHTLIHDVLVDNPGRDNVRDFLAQDAGIYKVYDSENQTKEVEDVSASATLQFSHQNGTEYYYNLVCQPTADFAFLQIADPNQGQKPLAWVTRSDGKIIKPANAWLDKSKPFGQSNWQYRFNLFDTQSSGFYTVVFGEAISQNHAPLFEPIDLHKGTEGVELFFKVKSTDPDGPIPILSANNLPVGATFIDNQDGTGTFTWKPATGQAGEYNIVFTAADVFAQTTALGKVQIHMFGDTDGDQLADSWEMEHFGTLERDGTGDYDGDTFSDMQEFKNKTDPDFPGVPSRPEIIEPLDGAEVSVQQPVLKIKNSSNFEYSPVSLEFEVYKDLFMTAKVDAGIVAAGSGESSWTVSQVLEENGWYYWRARGNDGFTYSQWTYGKFMVNMQNDQASAALAAQPGNNNEVVSRNPLLEVLNASDPDGDALTYQFEVYADQQLGNRVAASGQIQPGAERTFWRVNVPLTDQTQYFWRVIVTDSHGAATAGTVSSFAINLANQAPDEPVIIAPAIGSSVIYQSMDLTVANVANPDGNGDTVYYNFEIDKVATFDSADLQKSGNVAAGQESTYWNVSGLSDLTRYHWRVKTTDGKTSSDWVYGQFLISSVNKPPATPTGRDPGNPSFTETKTPTIRLNPATDPNQDPLTYKFEIYSDADLKTLFTSGTAKIPSFLMDKPLTDRNFYYWRAQTEDEKRTASNWTPVGKFFVKKSSQNLPPAIAMLEPNQNVFSKGQAIVLRWEDDDPDTNADISLYYTTAKDQPGTLIQSGIKEDPDGQGDMLEWDITAIADGTYFIYAEISDGTASAKSFAPGTVTIDRSIPTISADPKSGFYQTPATITLTASEDANIYYTLDGSDPDQRAIHYDQPFIIAQSCTLKFLAIDTAGNTSAIGSETYVIGVDNTVKLLSKPPDWSQNKTPAWTWEAVRGMRDLEGYRCQIAGAGIDLMVTETGFTAPPLPDGRYTFSVCVKYSGLFGPMTSQEFGIDTTPPILESILLNDSAAVTDNPVVQLAMIDNNDGSGSGIAEREFSIDDGEFQKLIGTAITLPAVFGYHMVTVRLKDGVGLFSENRSADILLTQVLTGLKGSCSGGTHATLRELNTGAKITAAVSDGQFTFANIPAGLYGLSAGNDNLTGAYQGRLSLYENTPLDIGALNIGTMAGQVDGQLTPATANVRVTIGVDLGFGYYLPLKETATATDGHFGFAGLVPGLYQIKAWPDISTGLAQQELNITVKADETTPAAITLSEGFLFSGTVNHSNLAILVFNPRYQVFSCAVAPEANTYQLVLPNGDYTVVTRDPYFYLTPIAVKMDNAVQLLDLNLIPRALDQSGKLLQGDALPAETGIAKALQLDPLNAPLMGMIPASQEVRPAGPQVNFWIAGDPSGGDSYHFLILADDFSSDIHAINQAPAVKTGSYEYKIDNAGAKIKGLVTYTQIPAVQPLLYLCQQVDDRLAGFCQGGINGLYFFKHVPAGEYYLKVIFANGQQKITDAFTLETGKELELNIEGVDIPPNAKNFFGSWPGLGVWERLGQSGKWEKVHDQEAIQIAAGDMDGDGEDDLVGWWDIGLWVRYQDGKWEKLLAADSVKWITAGDIDGGGRDDLIGSWENIGVWVRYSETGIWERLHNLTAQQVTAGDLKGDGKDELIGWWEDPQPQGPHGIWIRYAENDWACLLPDAGNLNKIASGDVNGDGRDDFLGSWSFGVWCRISKTRNWLQLHNQTAEVITAGDINGKGQDDLLGVWPSVSPGIWIRWSETGIWEKFHEQSPTGMAAGRIKKDTGN